MNLTTFTQPFVELWGSFVEGLVLFIPALLVFIVGVLIANLLYKTIVKLFAVTKIDQMVKPIAGAVEKAGYKLRIGHVIGWLAKWFVLVLTLMVSLDILKLDAVSAQLEGLVAYIPTIIIAIVILFVGFLLGDFVKKVIKGSTKMLNFKSAALLGNIARIAILVLTSLIVLNMLGIAPAIINIILIGVVTMIALAGGLAFGLGGRDAAAKAIEDAKNAFHK